MVSPLAMYECFFLVTPPQVLRSATALLAKFISTRESNIKYLGLETLMRLVEVPAVVETIDKWGLLPSCNWSSPC